MQANLLALSAITLWGTLATLGVALSQVPPVQANLVNYLWPLLMVVLAPVFLPHMRLRPVHLVAAAGPGATCRLCVRRSSGPAIHC